MPAQTALSSDNTPDSSLGEANVRALSKLQATLQDLCDEVYTKAPAKGLSPIGGHVRHIIEFYQEFFKAVAEGFTNGLSYDNRARNMLYETSRVVAVAEIEKLKKRCTGTRIEDTPIALSMTIDPAQPLCSMTTTPERELFHLLDHATHHMALIKMTAAQLGAQCDENFGMANATLAHNKGSSQG